MTGKTLGRQISAFLQLGGIALLLLSLTHSGGKAAPQTQTTGKQRLAFVRADGIWTVASDGTALRKVYAYQTGISKDRFGSRITCPPAWSPTGDRLCIGSNSAQALLVIDLKGKLLRRIPPLAPRAGTVQSATGDYDLRFTNVYWAQDNRIVAEYEEGQYGSSIMVWDGRKVQRIGSGRSGVYARHSDVSRDGNWIIYAEDRGGLDHDIGDLQEMFLEHLVNRRRTRLYKTTRHPANHLSLSPDGGQACFQRKSDQTGNLPPTRMDGLWVVNRNGNLRQLVHTTWAILPKWSPDGRWIAFSDFSEAADALRLYDLKTGSVRQLHAEPKNSFTWTQDSQGIVADGLVHISVPDGKVRQLAPDGIGCDSTAW